MKILMVVENIFTGDTRVENEALSLISAGHEVSIVCRSKTKFSVTEIYKNITLYRIHIPGLIYKSSVGVLKIPIYSNHWKRAIERILRQTDIDVIHLHDLPLVKVCYDLANKYHLKMVLDLHENWPALLNISGHTKTFLGRILCSIPQWERYEAKYINLMEKIIVVVDEAKERLVNLGVEEEKVSVISNYLKIETLKPFSEEIKRNERIEFVYIGGATFHRGLQYVLQAASLLKEYSDKFTVKIIGDGSYLPRLKDLSNKLSLSNVYLTGWLSDIESFEELSHGDIGIIPHIKSEHSDNTIPHKLFFYMYYGFPIIASDCNPIKRIILESDAGVIFKSGDYYEFAECMKRFIHEPELIQSYSKSRKSVEGKYNWGIEEKTLIELYALQNHE